MDDLGRVVDASTDEKIAEHNFVLGHRKMGEDIGTARIRVAEERTERVSAWFTCEILVTLLSKVQRNLNYIFEHVGVWYY